MNKLPREFYQQEDVVKISKELLGKFLFSNIDGCGVTGGVIVETEAYAGVTDRACHAFGHRRTKRTEVMYRPGSVCYVYLCYGMHVLFNVVTHKENVPHAILIRAIQPTQGISLMLKRRGKEKLTRELTAGPGALTQALGIELKHNGNSLLESTIWIEDSEALVDSSQIIESPRVGVAYAQEDALLPWRFRLAENLWTSKAK